MESGHDMVKLYTAFDMAQAASVYYAQKTKPAELR
jgi:hypothetical protein